MAGRAATVSARSVESAFGRRAPSPRRPPPSHRHFSTRTKWLFRLGTDRSAAPAALATFRYARGGSEGTFGLARRTMSKGARAIAKPILPPVRQFRVTDPMSGLFLVRRDRLQGVDLRPTGYKILLEVLGKAPLRRVEEVGY